MSNRTAGLPRKCMSEVERRFLKIAGQELAKVQVGGAAAMAVLLEMVASWHGNRRDIGFHDFGQLWLQEGNCANKATATILKDLFGVGDPEPTPRRIGRAA
ncbi:hypothetical protein H3221_016490 [Pseudomonas sp. LMG 31766]|uniref:Uncharacterized protein n=1 Tax=Pseudomonas chaetocerotis TaxID=2758695 RepID=A0A931D4D7_9PSED|nr:hypothetical protein [Pseudomonas chaetocerotis]MBZ9666343.1 hypothetical protein [Pseudomonas chaetocerotis]